MQAGDGIRDFCLSRGLEEVYKGQTQETRGDRFSRAQSCLSLVYGDNRLESATQFSYYTLMGAGVLRSRTEPAMTFQADLYNNAVPVELSLIHL